MKLSKHFHPEGKDNGNMSDLKKTLDTLRAYGKKGCHSFILMKLVGSTRVAARVDDLQKQGYHITSIYEDLDGTPGCRYFLHEERKLPKKIIFDNENNTFVYA